MKLRNKRKGLITGIVIFLILLYYSNALAKENEELNLKEQMVRLEIKIEKLETRVDAGFKAVNQRIDDMKGLIYVILAGIISLIGFVLWDRRTTVAPIAHELKEVVKQEGLLIDVLKRYARQEPRMAQAIKAAGIL